MKQKIIILGADGYLGYPLAVELANDGHEVIGVDNFSKRDMLRLEKSFSITQKYKKSNTNFNYINLDIRNKNKLSLLFKEVKPDVIFNFAHIPSAPYSMKNFYNATFTFDNNIQGTLSLIYSVKENCPEAHIITLGTMGEYPPHCNVDIPEGDFQFEYNGRKSIPLPFPKVAGSWYHWSKCAMSNIYWYAAKIWNLKISDIYQGIIYGVNTENARTNFYVDQCFGTVLNRFVAQAIAGKPLTVYGEGTQQRAFLSLRDAVQCYKLIMDNPPECGKYEVYNQFDEAYSIIQLAELVSNIGDTYKLNVTIKEYDNPRFEPQQENYFPVHEKLKNLGYKRTNELTDELKNMFKTLIPQREEILKLSNVLEPTTKWSETYNE